MAAGPPAPGRSTLNTAADTRVVVADDALPLALHELGGGSGLPPLLISHATGFHGRCCRPLADAVADRFHCSALDHRGHGVTGVPPGWSPGDPVDWRPFGDDTLTVARTLAPAGGLVGFGHSMGGASLLMAAHRHPRAFSRLVLFEPIAGPSPTPPIDPESIPLVIGSRRRRRRFGSTDEAYANYHQKPPMSLMTPASLRQYVDHGFRATADGDVELCCPPEFEAATFAGSMTNGVWDVLPEIDVPTLVVTGIVEDDQPSGYAEPLAARLPRGELLILPHQTHFGPFSHPAEVAHLIK